MSLLNHLKKPIAEVVKREAPPASTENYFYKQFPSGATIGRADERDPSGRPFFAYRDPVADATTTDLTRIATIFDPTVAQPLTKEQYYNPRAVEERQKIRELLGASYSDELDHAIALTVGGSNDPANLRVIPGRLNQKYGKYEAKLAQQLRAGTISYLDAQVADAKHKKVEVPWVPPDVRKDDPKVWDDFRNFVAKKIKTKPKVKTSPELFNSQESAFTRLLDYIGVIK